MKARLHQGSALGPFLFNIVVDELTKRGLRQSIPRTMMYTDDVVFLCGKTKIRDGGVEEGGTGRQRYEEKSDENGVHEEEVRLDGKVIKSEGWF